MVDAIGNVNFSSNFEVFGPRRDSSIDNFMIGQALNGSSTASRVQAQTAQAPLALTGSEMTREEFLALTAPPKEEPPAPVVDPRFKEYDPEKATELAKDAHKNVVAEDFGKATAKLRQIRRKQNQPEDAAGPCARYVRQAFERNKLTTGVKFDSAYMWADSLAKNKNFKEVTVTKEDLKNLPEGFVIVYKPGAAKYHKKYGHILITKGNGQGASFFVEDIRPADDVRVFMPVAQQKNPELALNSPEK